MYITKKKNLVLFLYLFLLHLFYNQLSEFMQASRTPIADVDNKIKIIKYTNEIISYHKKNLFTPSNRVTGNFVQK